MTDLMLDEPNDYKIFCSWKIHRLMSYSKIVTLAVAERNTDVREAVTLSVHPIR
jgi:hypothetical protein